MTLGKQEEHGIILNRASGKEEWIIKCGCGRVWKGWRWLCEEYYNEHLPAPEPIETYLNWTDDASYAQWQSRP
jgi:hypothetical protein